MDELILEMKKHLIEALNLEDMTPEDIDADELLYTLGLDSIDALEVIIIMEKTYGIKIPNATEMKPHFKSVRTLAEFVQANRTK